MKMFEILGNCPPAWNMDVSTMAKVLGERATLGAAKRLANELMLADMAKPWADRQFVSVDVDDGRGGVLYTATPITAARYLAA